MTIFVIASACCMWYFSHGPGEELHLPVLRSYGRAFRYHFGSLAFGSMLLSVVQFLEIIVETIKSQIEKANKGGENAANKCVNCCVDCMRCCLACVERIVQFINKNAYILIALSGKNFCSSAKEGFEIVWSNPIRYAVVSGVGEVVMFLGKLLIACSTTSCVYLYITYNNGTRVMSSLLFLLVLVLLLSSYSCTVMQLG
jgi:choline transporter-like protein 2/4/5